MKYIIALSLSIMLATTATTMEVALGHSGGLSKKDQCHNMRDRATKKIVERHWHKLGTAKKGGICVDGRQVPAEPSYQDLKASMQKLQQSLHESNGRESASSSALNDLRRSLTRIGKQHKRALRNANDTVDAAELREQMMERKLQSVTSGDPICVRERTKLEGKAMAGMWSSRGWRDVAVNLLECLSAGE